MVPPKLKKESAAGESKAMIGKGREETAGMSGWAHQRMFVEIESGNRTRTRSLLGIRSGGRKVVGLESVKKELDVVLCSVRNQEPQFTNKSQREEGTYRRRNEKRSPSAGGEGKQLEKNQSNRNRGGGYPPVPGKGEVSNPWGGGVYRRKNWWGGKKRTTSENLYRRLGEE